MYHTNFSSSFCGGEFRFNFRYMSASLSSGSVHCLTSTSFPSARLVLVLTAYHRLCFHNSEQCCLYDILPLAGTSEKCFVFFLFPVHRGDSIFFAKGKGSLVIVLLSYPDLG